MQKLKILSLFITLALLGILITSCEKENLVNDSITLAEQPLLEIKHNNPNLNEISLRNFQGLDEVYVDYLLREFLVERIIAFNNNPVPVRETDVINMYEAVANYIDFVFCSTGLVNQQHDWGVSGTDQINQSDIDAEGLVGDVEACPFYIINSLLRMQGAIEEFLDDQNCTNRKSVSIKIRDFVLTLNNCFGDTFPNNFTGLRCIDYQNDLDDLFVDVPGCDQSFNPKCN